MFITGLDCNIQSGYNYLFVCFFLNLFLWWFIGGKNQVIYYVFGSGSAVLWKYPRWDATREENHHHGHCGSRTRWVRIWAPTRTHTHLHSSCSYWWVNTEWDCDCVWCDVIGQFWHQSDVWVWRRGAGGQREVRGSPAAEERARLGLVGGGRDGHPLLSVPRRTAVQGIWSTSSWCSHLSVSLDTVQLHGVWLIKMLFQHNTTQCSLFPKCSTNRIFPNYEWTNGVGVKRRKSVKTLLLYTWHRRNRRSSWAPNKISSHWPWPNILNSPLDWQPSVWDTQPTLTRLTFTYGAFSRTAAKRQWPLAARCGRVRRCNKVEKSLTLC